MKQVRGARNDVIGSVYLSEREECRNENIFKEDGSLGSSRKCGFMNRRRKALLAIRGALTDRGSPSVEALMRCWGSEGLVSVQAGV